MATSPPSDPRFAATEEILPVSLPGRLWLRRHPGVAVLVGLVSLLVVFGVAWLLAGPRFLGNRYLRQAEAARERGDFAAAQGFLEQALRWQPQDADLYLQVARLRRRRDDLDGARAALKQGLEHGLPQPAADLESLLQQAQAGAFASIEPELGRYLSLQHPDEALILEAWVRGTLRACNFERAWQLVQLWVKHQPDNWMAHYWKGQTLEQGLRFDLAAEAYAAAIERQPDGFDVQLRRGTVLQLKGRYPEALPHLQRWVQTHPDDAAGLYGLARCQLNLAHADEARDLLQRLLAKYPEHGRGLTLLGQIELEYDRPAEALAVLKKAEAMMPLDLETNQQLIIAYRRLGNGAEADRYETQRAEIDKQAHRVEELHKEIQQRPDDISRRAELATILLRLGRGSEAVPWLVSVLLLDPRHRPALSALAEYFQRQGQTELAERYRRRAGG